MSQSSVPAIVTEANEIRAAMLALLQTWASVESSFAIILRNVIHDPSGDIAFAIYFSPTSMDARFQIVDSAIRALVSEKKHPALLSLWSSLFDSIKRSKAMRNNIAHGTIGTVSVKNKNHARLLPPMFDFKRIQRAIQKKQIPGWGANELRQSQKKMGEAIESLALVSEWVVATSKGDGATSQKTLAALESRLRKLSSLPDPNQQAQKDPASTI